VEQFCVKFGNPICVGFFEITCGKTDRQTRRQTDRETDRQMPLKTLSRDCHRRK